MIHFDMPKEKSNNIKVLGFGGGGGNAVNHMYRQNIQNVDFIICNTDAQALQVSPVPNKIQLGPHLTQGLGAGANPEIGKQAAEESMEEIRRMLEVNTKMAFITAGMGGGTGTGGAPTVARICKELGVLTVAIVTTPFQFEGPKRMAQARQGINELKEQVDTLLVISNDKLRHQFGNLKMRDAFAKADDILATAARCITDVINTTGQINVDFADVCTVMKNGGVAILGSAAEAGEDRALKAIEAAINSPLLNDNDISGAKWILLNICSSEGDFEYTMDEVDAIQQYVRNLAGESTDVILGMGFDESLGDKLGITIIATGFKHKDPFEKPVVKKPEPKQEAPIIMTLGVAGEERKMEIPTHTAPAPAAQPVVTEDPLMPIMNELPKTHLQEPVIFEEPWPVPAMPAPPENKTATPAEPEEKLVFELSLDMPENTVTPAPANDAQAPASEIEMFLSKPAQIYSQVPKVEETQEDALKFELTELPEAKPVPQAPPPPVVHTTFNEEDEEVAGITLSIQDETPPPAVQRSLFEQGHAADLSDEEEQKRRARERMNRLRNLSFNPSHLDQNSEFEQVPAYMRRDLDLHNSIANVEDFYSRAQVSSNDKNQATISTLNNFLHGEKPD